MWATLDLLVRREARGRDLSENVEEWLETVNRKIAASADGVKEKRRKGRKKGKGRNDVLREEEKNGEETATTSDTPPKDKKTDRGQDEGEVVVEEEPDGKSGVRTWNPREGKRSHDRDIRKRLEQLMGSSVVNITDRKYMLELQQRIIELHYENTEKRMANRMYEEIEREKRLVLENKMPMAEGSDILATHPVFMVNQRFEKNPRVALLKGETTRKKRTKKPDDVEAVIRKQEDQERRMDMGSRGVDGRKSRPRERPKDVIGHGDHAKESSESKSDFSGFKIGKAEGSMKVLLDLSEFRSRKDERPEGGKAQLKRLFEATEGDLASPSSDGDYLDIIEWDEDLDSDDMLFGGEEDGLTAFELSQSEEERNLRDEEDKEYMLPENKIETLKYESPLVKELRRAKTVEELYSLADQIVGPVPEVHAK